MKFFTDLNREQKEAIGLLQIGTFLEYFDLMIYVHMAVVLNELFFPKTDPHTAALITAFAFCSTYVLRPFGALVFGYIGDTIGRKTTVIITTMMMAFSCIIMANLPTYAQIGMSAAWIVTICRIIQGLSSMGEIIGAQVYVSEITRPPAAYPAVSFISASAAVGSMAAVGVAALTTNYGFNWRTAFWIGACIAMVGSVARTRLRETPEFVDMKRRLKLLVEASQKNHQKSGELLKNISKFSSVKIPRLTLIYYFLIQCGWPISFYLVFIYFNPTLKDVYGYTSEQVIAHNFFLTVVQVFQGFGWSVVSYYVHPLKILRLKGICAVVLMLCVPFCLLNQVGAIWLFWLQASILVFNMGDGPAQYVFLKNLPIYKRFTTSSFAYALGRAITYIVTSFGIVYLTQWFSHWGLLFITMPMGMLFLLSISYFNRLQNTLNNEKDSYSSNFQAVA